ncbi:unnamed protein product [Ectocarpus sp. 12 AP-2014]
MLAVKSKACPVEVANWVRRAFGDTLQASWSTACFPHILQVSEPAHPRGQTLRSPQARIKLSNTLGVLSRLLVHGLVATIVCSVYPRRSCFCRTFVEGSTSQVVRRSLPTRPGSIVGVN